MGYMHIDNLYKNTAEMLMFKQVFALEKIHGTSAHIKFENGAITYFSGGSKYNTFVELFDNEELYAAFMELGHDPITVYGEACGGKIQKMRHLYGDSIRFPVFDVKVGETWLNVPNAADVASKLGLEFVPYEQIDTSLDKLDELRDAPSAIAVRWGCEGGLREGIVIRPLMEIINNKGNRVMAKHKTAAFSEHTPKEIDPDKAVLRTAAEEIAFKWVNDMRLAHVLDALESDHMVATHEERQWDIKDTRQVIHAMIEDLRREGRAEFEMDKLVSKCVGSRTAQMFQAWLSNRAQAEVVV